MSVVTLLVVTDNVLKTTVGFARNLINDLSLFRKSYLPQKINIQGFPSSEKRNSGSNLSFRPIVITIIAAGLPNVRLGMEEIPLLVTVIVVLKVFATFRLSDFCENEKPGMLNSKRSVREILTDTFIIMHPFRLFAMFIKNPFIKKKVQN